MYDRNGTAAASAHIPASNVAVVPYFHGRTGGQVGKDELDTQRVQLFGRRRLAGGDKVRNGRTPVRVQVSLPSPPF